MNLPRKLFWDVNPDNIDYEKHARFVIERVVTRGSLDDWRAIRDFYGLERIKREVVEIRCLDDRTLNYLSLVLEIPKPIFRCFTNRSSALRHLPF